MTLGQRIQDLRKQNGLSQEALGEALGVSRQAVSKWEGDNGIPELDTLIAMSRLFGVTIGELLGVEAPAQQPAAGEEDTRMEELLRRYAQQREEKQPVPKQWKAAAAVAAAAVLAVLVILFVQLSSLRTTVRYLRSEVSSLQMQVSNNLSSLSGQIRSTIYEILEEEAALLNTFSWELVGFDLGAQTATVRLNATMKAYQAGNQVQFLADWAQVDGTEGKTTSDWAEGPDFSVEMTLPMNHRTDLIFRVRDTEGNLQEQAVAETLYALHPENFQLTAYNLMAPVAVTVRSFGVIHATSKAERIYTSIYSAHPAFIWPEEAVFTVKHNDAVVFTEPMSLKTSEEKGLFAASLAANYYDITLVEGDTLTVELQVTDNLGRRQTFLEGGTVKDGELQRAPMTAPAIPMD